MCGPDKWSEGIRRFEWAVPKFEVLRSFAKFVKIDPKMRNVFKQSEIGSNECEHWSDNAK